MVFHHLHSLRQCTRIPICTSLPILVNLFISISLNMCILAILMGTVWYSFVIFICTSLMIGDIDYHFMYSLAIFLSSFEK